MNVLLRQWAFTASLPMTLFPVPKWWCDYRQKQKNEFWNACCYIFFLYCAYCFKAHQTLQMISMAPKAHFENNQRCFLVQTGGMFCNSKIQSCQHEGRMLQEQARTEYICVRPGRAPPGTKPSFWWCLQADTECKRLQAYTECKRLQSYTECKRLQADTECKNLIFKSMWTPAYGYKH